MKSLNKILIICSFNIFSSNVFAQDLSSNPEFYNSDNEIRNRIIQNNLNNIDLFNDENINFEIVEELKKDKNDYERLKSFILTHNPKINNLLMNKIITNVNKYSQENNLDPKLIIALMAKESSFRVSVVSTSGAIGLGQLKRKTAMEVGIKNPFNPVENIKGTARYLSKLYKIFNGDINKTLASYYMGPGALKRNIQAGKKLPFKVTRYVNKIKIFHNNI
jgi:membrane-bound lytic murein transglycosylase MltF